MLHVPVFISKTKTGDKMKFSCETEYITPESETRLYLIRGHNGSGKSTLAKFICSEVVGTTHKRFHIEVDMFFQKGNDWIYEPARLQAAKDWCLNTSKVFLNNGYIVVVSNPFIKLWEMAKYIEFAKENNIGFSIVKMLDTYSNIHNIPERVVKSQIEGFEDYV
jgi:predicted kinase